MCEWKGDDPDAGKVKAPGGKIAMITSQGGSVAWRTVQNPTVGVGGGGIIISLQKLNENSSFDTTPPLAL